MASDERESTDPPYLARLGRRRLLESRPLRAWDGRVRASTTRGWVCGGPRGGLGGGPALGAATTGDDDRVRDDALVGLPGREGSGDRRLRILDHRSSAVLVGEAEDVEEVDDIIGSPELGPSPGGRTDDEPLTTVGDPDEFLDGMDQVLTSRSGGGEDGEVMGGEARVDVRVRRWAVDGFEVDVLSEGVGDGGEGHVKG